MMTEQEKKLEKVGESLAAAFGVRRKPLAVCLLSTSDAADD